MSAAVFLRRRVARLGIPPTVKDDITAIWHLREWTFGGATGWKQYGGGGRQGNCGFTTFDFMDMTCPHVWYPVARKKRRKVFLHVGPTNSGKTYSALKQLELSNSGIYCGPLRLLAWEVANRLNKANVPCDLITGQEREEIDGAKHKSMTVEMADISSDYSCAVIDEIQARIAQRFNARHRRNINNLAIINEQMTTNTLVLVLILCDSTLGSQMLSCRSRGHSFTRALLGIAADELHLCGDPAAVSLIEGILSETGDDLQVQYYKRLSPLVPSKYPLGSYSEIQKGDCIVTFSRQGVYRLKKHVEREGKHLCSIVYGSLPPETRTKQAALFNDTGSNIDVLVASDAIGMGLNLQISRIIFSTMQKFDGLHMRDLTVTEIKQIAGRAGRYGSKYPVGEVTCVDNEDLQMLHSAIDAPSPTLEHAGLFPHYDLILMCSHLHPKAGFKQILEQFLENAKLSSNYFIAESEDMLKIAVILDKLPLSVHDKYVFFMSPVDVNDEISTQGLTQFAHSYLKKSIVHLREIFTVGTLQVPTTPTKLKELESIHKVLDLYVWLSYRMEDSFPDREVALSQKALCSMLIEEFLLRYGGLLQRPKGTKLQSRKGLNKLF